MPNVFRLAYVDLATPSLDGARGYYQEEGEALIPR